MSDIDPFRRSEILAWLTANEFKDYEGHGYYVRAYALSHSYPGLKIGIPEGQICATVIIEQGNVDERKAILVGEAYSVAPIAALWAVLNLFDFADSRSSAYWAKFWADRPIPEMQPAGIKAEL